jgi:hypothetical protein
LLAFAMVLAGCIAEQGEVDDEVDQAPSALIVTVAPTTGGVGREKTGQPAVGTGVTTVGVKAPQPGDNGPVEDPDPNPWVPGMSGTKDH